VHVTGLLRALDALPWRAGTYLFPACLVEATGPTLHVWPIADAETVERVATPLPGLALHMGDGTHVLIPASNAEQAEQAEAALATLRPELARATAEEDAHVLAELDPLHDRAMSSPVGPTESMRPVVPVSKRFDWAIAAAVGVALGLTLGTTRNGMSDEAMMRSMVAAPTAQGYQLYLAHGGRHSDDVRDVLLPRTELRDAEAEGTDAVLAFAGAHPSSKIGPELDAALRRAMLSELDKTKKAHTVTAIDAFAQKYPNHKVDAELKAARHALYAEALTGWRRKAQPDATTEAFMARLLAWAEKRGPACEIRFRLKPSQTIERADRKAMSSGHYPGADALPSKYVSTDALRPREQRVAEAIVKSFTEAFPPDVLSARAGEPLSADAPNPATVPTLAIEYAPEWSGGTTLSVRRNTVFAGLAFAFDASFALPEGAPLKVSSKSWRGAELWKIKADGLTREEFEQNVYDTMIDGAFDQLGKKLVVTLF
jgi:hypothetical protein